MVTKAIVIVATGLLIFDFCYILLSKIRSRHTVALHRREVRRKPWEPADYKFMGIPVLTDSNLPEGMIYLQNDKGERRYLINKIDWEKVWNAESMPIKERPPQEVRTNQPDITEMGSD